MISARITNWTYRAGSRLTVYRTLNCDASDSIVACSRSGTVGATRPSSDGLPRTGKTGCGAFSLGRRKRRMQSDAIKKGISRAPARAMLKATGLKDADHARPLVAVANTW